MKRALLLALLIGCLGTAAIAQDAAYVLKLKPEAAALDPKDEASRLARTYGGTLDEGSEEVVIRLSPARADLLARDPKVESLRPARVASQSIDWNAGVAYEYDGAGNIKKIGTDTYSYDVVNRLVEGHTAGSKRQYEYDAFGNRTKCTQGEGSPCQDAEVISASSNRSSIATYDLRGNVTALGGHTYVYDELDRLKSDTVGGITREYVYDAEDQRIAVRTSSSAGSWWRWTVRDPLSGKPLRDFTSLGADGTETWKWERDYVWRNSLLLATVQPNSTGTATTTYHYHLDHLGTPRRVTNGNDLIVGVHDYHPFGIEVAGGTNEPSLSRIKYTGHERDTLETELGGASDYMMARYYSPSAGRFLSVDPVLNLKRALREPQNWNRYAYVMNNPLKYTDPTGKDVSIRLTFKGDGWTDEEKKRIITQVTSWYQNQKVGKVFVFDGAKANHGRNFLTRMFSGGYTSINVSSGTGTKHTPSTVFAGNYGSLSGAQRINAISNSIIHETAAHHFGATAGNNADQMFFARDSGYRMWDSVRSRYGTVADSYSYADPNTRGNVINGPIPIHPEDQKKLQSILRDEHVEPPDNDN